MGNDVGNVVAHITSALAAHGAAGATHRGRVTPGREQAPINTSGDGLKPKYIVRTEACMSRSVEKDHIWPSGNGVVTPETFSRGVSRREIVRRLGPRDRARSQDTVGSRLYEPELTLLSRCSVGNILSFDIGVANDASIVVV
jgi:hypothetical protein